jgi:two-component system cell cycle sensor histidine kinase/response regulator CckA
MRTTRDPAERDEHATSEGFRKTVLVVDDQEVLRKILIHALRQQGYQVLSAANGLEALRTIVSFSGRIDVLITDLMMPVMDGDELLAYVAVLRPEMKAICLSATVSELALRNSVLALPKPFSLQRVVQSVTEVLSAVPDANRKPGESGAAASRRPPAAGTQGF